MTVKEIEELFPKTFLARQGSSFERLQERLRLVGDEFVAALGAVDEMMFYTSKAGKWTPAQIADHVVRANRLFGKALGGVCDGCEVLVMARGQVTEDGRPLAPAEEEPSPGEARGDLIRDFERTLERLLAAGERTARAGLLSEVCIDQAFFGLMTGLECLQLSVWHIHHHTKQLPTPSA